MAYLGHISDVTVLGGPLNSRLVISSEAVRVRSSALHRRRRQAAFCPRRDTLVSHRMPLDCRVRRWASRTSAEHSCPYRLPAQVVSAARGGPTLPARNRASPDGDERDALYTAPGQGAGAWSPSLPHPSLASRPRPSRRFVARRSTACFRITTLPLRRAGGYVSSPQLVSTWGEMCLIMVFVLLRVRSVFG
jgi:hypothetical protein